MTVATQVKENPVVTATGNHETRIGCAQRTRGQREQQTILYHPLLAAGATRLALATSGVTGRCSPNKINDLSR